MTQDLRDRLVGDVVIDEWRQKTVASHNGLKNYKRVVEPGSKFNCYNYSFTLVDAFDLLKK